MAEHSSDISHFISVLHVEAKFLGIHPYRKDMQLSILGAVHSLTSMAGMLIGWIYLTAVLILEDNSNLPLVALCTISAFLAVLFSIHGNHYLKTVIDKLQELDESMWNMGIFPMYKSQKVMVEVLLRNAAYVLLCLLDGYMYDVTPFTAVGLATMVSLYYSYFVMSDLFLRLHHLLQIIGSHFQLINQRVVKCWPALCKTGGMKCVLDAHCRLLEICEHLNDWFSKLLLTIAVLVFVSTTMNIYRCMVLVISFFSGSASGLQGLTLLLAKIVLRFLEMWRLTHSLVHTQKQANMFSEDISEYIILGKQERRMEELEVHFALNPRVKFTANNYFTLDYAFLFGMLLANLTYVLMIMQFSSSLGYNLFDSFKNFLVNSAED